MMGKMCSLHVVAMVLVIVGALNWGLIGAVNFNLVSTIFGSVAWLERVIYILVGLSGLFMIPCAMGSCKSCNMPSGMGDKKM